MFKNKVSPGSIITAIHGLIQKALKQNKQKQKQSARQTAQGQTRFESRYSNRWECFKTKKPKEQEGKQATTEETSQCCPVTPQQDTAQPSDCQRLVYKVDKQTLPRGGNAFLMSSECPQVRT